MYRFLFFFKSISEIRKFFSIVTTLTPKVATELQTPVWVFLFSPKMGSSEKYKGIESTPPKCAKHSGLGIIIVIYPDGSFFFPKKLWMISFLTKLLSCCGFMIHDLLYLLGFVSK